MANATAVSGRQTEGAQCGMERMVTGMAELTMNVRIEPEDIANRVLDELEYNGKTIREWADGLANPRTQADRIRSMSDEELAEYLFERGNETEYCYGICAFQDRCRGPYQRAFCLSQIETWLKQEVEDGR